MSRARDVSLAAAVRRAYEAGEEDERLEPIVAAGPEGRPLGRIEAGDSVVFWDVRGEREITLTRCLTQPERALFPAARLGLNFVTLIQYSPSLPARAAFPPENKLRNTLTEVLCRAGYGVVKIAESEKATHVGYFFNGKTDRIFEGEERVIVPSPRVERYSEHPAMSADRVAEEIATRLRGGRPRAIVANLANVDEVGHLEDRPAVLEAVRTVDRALAKVVAAATEAGATLLVTADHGTVEEWLYPDGTVNTGHTSNPVPFVLADFAAGPGNGPRLEARGGLADIAPTILDLTGLERPPEMTGRTLVAGGRAGRPPRKTILLLILDGWGLRDEAYGNMIREAGAPNFERLWRDFPHAVLASAGEDVGMPAGTVGNSEAGHLHLGAGRTVCLERVRIDKAIASGDFFRNDSLLWAMDRARSSGRTLHLMGVVSFYSSHGTIRHLFALMRLARQAGLERVFVHAFIGRRNDKPETGAVYVEKIEETAREVGAGRVVTVMGRYWPLVREATPERVEKAYRALVFGEGKLVRLSP